MNEEITLSDADHRRVVESTEKGVRSIEQYTRLPAAKQAPRKFIGTLTRGAYLALTDEQRLSLVRENLLAVNLAEALSKRARFLAAQQEQREARRAAAATPEAPTVTPPKEVDPVTSGSWFVPCADGCGVLVPASGPRAIVAYKDGHRPAPKRKKPKRVED